MPFSALLFAAVAVCGATVGSAGCGVCCGCCGRCAARRLVWRAEGVCRRSAGCGCPLLRRSCDGGEFSASCLFCLALVWLSGLSAGLFACALSRFAACSLVCSFAAALVCLVARLAAAGLTFSLLAVAASLALFVWLAFRQLLFVFLHEMQAKNKGFRLLSIGTSGSSLLARVRGDAALSVCSLARRRRLLVCLHKRAAKN